MKIGDCHSDSSQGNLSFSLGFSFEFNSERACFSGFFLPFVKSIKVFDEKYFEFNSQNKEIVLF
ncbi:hypothetical protein Q7W20_06710, partial [Streptococcus suis]|nr:hypothetical protein [Streptococcus suis]